MSHCIHMLSIQIDTKNPGLIIHHQFNNIKLSFFAGHNKMSFHYVRLLDTLEYTAIVQQEALYFYLQYYHKKVTNGLIKSNLQ